MISILELFPHFKNTLETYKAHFAQPNNGDDPLVAFAEDKFQDWQAYQKKRNFERDYIISFISYDVNEWLFAGIYKSLKKDWVVDHWEYCTEISNLQADLIGRLIVHFNKSRQSYLKLENCIYDLKISQILKERYAKIEFPGYENIIINFSRLQSIINNRKVYLDWYTALNILKGVYLITDKSNGQHYVGSAYGKFALWSRWSQYIHTGHGGNDELIEVINAKGVDYAENFQFSILKTFPADTDKNKIIECEQHWKNALMSQRFGYNN